MATTSTAAGFAPFTTMDRQWDARFNVPTDEDLDRLLTNVRVLDDQGKFQYVLVSGIEIGERPFQTDYLIRHVHCAFVYPNRISKGSVLKQLGIKQGLGYYLALHTRS